MSKDKNTIDMLSISLSKRLFDEDDFKSLSLRSERDSITVLKEANDGFYYTLEGSVVTVPKERIFDELRRLIDMGFHHVTCESYSGTVEIDILPKGQIKVKHLQQKVDIDVDRLIDPHEISELLETIEMTSSGGSIKMDMLRKYAQVENFIKVIEPILRKSSERGKIYILDCAAGKSYLSYIMNYFIREKLRRSCHFYCIDTNSALIEKCIRISEKLHYSNMEFHVSQVLDFFPDNPIDIVCSLHACDTATDEAIAKGITLNASFLLVVPCCQHEVLNQLKNHPLKAITRHGVYKARLADLLTDAIRTLILESAGYKVSVVEFVSPTYTPKNIMIQAEKIQSVNKMAIEQYIELKRMFNIEISLEKMSPLDIQGSEHRS